MTPKKFIVILISLTVILFVLVAVYFTTVLSSGVPSLEQLENPKQNLASTVLSSDGELLDHYYIERRTNLSLNDIPEDFINGLIATEDRKFWSHWGVHLERIIKANIKNAYNLSIQEGGSTITQQLARNLFLNQEVTVTRKIREAYVAVKIEQNFTKREILEMYCNTVYFGRGAYGFAVAAKAYFDKEPYKLTAAECALLVALLKGPNIYDPAKNYDKALSRRNLILKIMHDEERLTDEQFLKAIEEPIELKRGKIRNAEQDIAPHFVEMVRQNLSKDYNLSDYNLYRDGLIIKTTLNAKIQRHALAAVKEHLEQYQRQFNASWSWSANRKLLNQLIDEAIKERPEYKSASGARKKDIADELRYSRAFIDSVKTTATTIQIGMVVLDPVSGAILGMVGASPKFMEDNFYAKYSLNHVTQIRRQPGSSIKPFVYAVALRKGLTPWSNVECGPYTWKNPDTGELWTPASGSNCAEGEQVTLIDALRLSINSVSARLATEYGTPGEVLSLLRRAGVTSNLQAVPAISLGAGGEVSPLEMASAFTAFANNGLRTEPYYKLRIEDQRGNILYEDKNNRNASEVVDPEVAHELTYMMQQVVNGGTAARVRTIFTGVEAAGKTGTTNKNADAWFIGYTPQLLAAVWVGFDDQRINFNPVGANGQGGRAAAPIWARLMQKIYADPTLPFRQRSFNYKIMERQPEDFEFNIHDNPADNGTGTSPTIPDLDELEKEDVYVPKKKEEYDPFKDEPAPPVTPDPRLQNRDVDRMNQRQEPPKPMPSTREQNPRRQPQQDEPRKRFKSDQPRNEVPPPNSETRRPRQQ